MQDQTAETAAATTDKPYSITLWGSHPDADNDDCWRVAMSKTTHIQVTENAKDSREAADMLAALAAQHGYVGGRTLEAGAGKPDRVQAFFVDDTDGECWLPDGMRRVFVPTGQKRALGITE